MVKEIDPGSRELLVVKYGSESCTDEEGLRQDRLALYAGHIAQQKEIGRDVVVVASGAVAVANSLLPQNVTKSTKVNSQLLATYGNPIFMRSWQDSLQLQGIFSGELLVTSHEIDDRSDKQMLVKTIKQQLAAGWVSLVNENDGLSDEEVKALSYGGDNDGLAQHLAIRLGASELCFMTEQRGLLDERGNPLHKIAGKDIKKALSLAKGPGPLGKGGMKSKVQAAILASQNGINTHIGPATASLDDVIHQRVGTHFVPVNPAV